MCFNLQTEANQTSKEYLFTVLTFTFQKADWKTEIAKVKETTKMRS